MSPLNVVLILLFGVGAGAFVYGASLGFRGKVLYSDYYGESISDRVKVDPRLRAKANSTFKVWCLTAAVLTVAPIVWIATNLTRDLSTVELALVAAYAFIVVVIGGYPHEKIKHL